MTCDPVIQRMSEILIGKCRFNGAYIVQWIFVYREVVNALCELWMAVLDIVQCDDDGCRAIQLGCTLVDG